RSVEVGEGSFFGEHEDYTHSRVAVIGAEVKKKLFSGQNALGESIRIDGISYQVIGILKHMLSNGDDDMNAMVYVPYSAMGDLKVITMGIKVLLGFIGMLTLGIGGVGLMNIMLVSVTQRTREIGVEKALGARRWHILFQFLAEAMVITLLGGLAGVVIAYLISWSVGSLTLWSAFLENANEGDIHLTIDSGTLIAATAILSFVGIISGMLPAIKAA